MRMAWHQCCRIPSSRRPSTRPSRIHRWWICSSTKTLCCVTWARSDEFRRMLTDPNALRQMSQMSRAMGMNPLGGGIGGAGGGLGGGSTSAFPAPGVTDTTPSEVAGGNVAANPSPTPNTTTNNLPFGYGLLNPMGGGMGGPGPSGSMPPHPFAALFGADNHHSNSNSSSSSNQNRHRLG